MHHAFYMIPDKHIKNTILVLDVDGTITPTGSKFIGSKTLKKIKALKKNNRIYLCSNTKDTSRIRQMAEMMGVDYLKTVLKKPRKGIMNEINNQTKLPVLVIGDKLLTDGLFAYRTGSNFIKVKRLTIPSDPLYDRFLFLIDDCAYILFKLLYYLIRFFKKDFRLWQNYQLL